VPCFDLTIIGECKKNYSKALKISRQTCQQIVRVVGGLGCGWAKLNVVQKRWLCESACTSFNFAKRWHFRPPFSVS